MIWINGVIRCASRLKQGWLFDEADGLNYSPDSINKGCNRTIKGTFTEVGGAAELLNGCAIPSGYLV